MIDGDFIEFGDGLVAAKDGWFWDNNRQVYIDTEGTIRSEEEYENHDTPEED